MAILAAKKDAEMSVILIFLFTCLCGIAHCASITSSTYLTRQIVVEPANEFTLALFAVEFDSQPYLASIPIHELSISTSNVNGRPIASNLLKGIANLICPCVDCRTEDFVECSNTTDVCIYTHNSGPEMQRDANLINIPSRVNPLYTSYIMFSDDQVIHGNAGSMLANTVYLAKILSSYESAIDRWVRYVPEKLDISKCKIHFRGQHDGAYLTDASNDAIGPLNTTKLEPMKFACNSAHFASNWEQVTDAISNISLDWSRANLRRNMRIARSHLLKNAWLGCEQLTESLLISKSQKLNFTDDRCHYSPFDENRYTDPCCNETLLFTDGCYAKNVSVNTTLFTEVNTTLVNELCRTPDVIEELLKEHIESRTYATSCDQRIRRQGWDTTYWDSFKGFLSLCKKQVFGEENTPPRCLHDTDCWTYCDQATRRCVVPWDDPMMPVLRCIRHTADTEIYAHLMDKMDLLYSSPDATIRTYFTALTGIFNCGGPLSYEHQSGMWDVEVESCEGYANCECPETHALILGSHAFKRGNFARTNLVVMLTTRYRRK